MKNLYLLEALEGISLVDFKEVTSIALCDYYRDNKLRFEGIMPTVGSEFYTDAYWLRQQSSYEKEYALDQAVRFCLIKDNRVIAHINFTQIFRGGFQACFLGYGVDKAYQGKNIMYTGLGQAIDLMFKEQGLHRIMANYVPDNKRSEALLMRLGFQKEGYAKSYLKLNGKWQDHVLTSLINSP